MKLLALSDIHSNLIAVRKMRAQERNVFDAIVIAGDLGGDAVEGLSAKYCGLIGGDCLKPYNGLEQPITS